MKTDNTQTNISKELIGQDLRRVYHKAIDAPLPDRFNLLLERLTDPGTTAGQGG